MRHLIIIIIYTFFLCFAMASCDRGDAVADTGDESSADNIRESASVALRVSNRVGNLARQFNDLNPAHLAVADSLGITPIQSPRDAWLVRRPLERVATCEDFRLDSLTHSYPYLVPEAAALLHELGRRFSDSIAARSGADYRMIVTSVLRTAESVGRLKRRNINSTLNSAHLYGTTFDVSYVRFNRADSTSVECREGDMKNLLAEILMDLRDEGRCLVKYERKQGCFHITARN